MLPENLKILEPVFGLVCWTFLMLLLIAIVRIVAVVRKQLSLSAFQLGESLQVPEFVLIINRNYMNLLELPLLFYVACLIVLVTHIYLPIIIGLAWVYVILRIVHSLIHIIYNNVLHRFTIFALSNFVLLALWLIIGASLYVRSGSHV